MQFIKRKFFVILFLFSLTPADDSPKIGLVLSGGGSKGFAHIPILKALDSLNIKIDYIAGTSMGAIAGAMYALGYSGKEIEVMALETDWYEILNDEPKRKQMPYFRKKDTGKYQLEFGLDGVKPVQPTGFIQGQKVILELSKWTREYEQVYDFDNFPIPFRCNAFDIISGKEFIFKEGSLANALRASLSIPTVFAPVEYQGALLVDGGVINNLPVDIAKEMGADIILAVNTASSTKTLDQLDNIFDVLEQAISVHEYSREYENMAAADYFIQVNIKGISATDYSVNTMIELFNRGENAVTDNWGFFQKLQELSNAIEKSKLRLQSLKRPVISGIKIKGNNELPRKFIRDYIGMEKGDKLNVETLDENISELYSLGYFKTLYYEIYPEDNEMVKLIIHVKEKPMRNFQLGLRWDNLYGLVGVANVQVNSILLPGLRLENQIQFAGFRKNQFSIYYPSRQLNFPVYPFIRINNSRYLFYSYSIDGLYDGTYTHTSDGVIGGLGILLQNYWNTEVEYFWGWVNFKPDFSTLDESNTINGENITGVRVTSQLDLLDDVLLPGNGILVKGKYENSSAELGSERNYHLYQGEGDLYLSRGRNTFRLKGYYHQGLNDLPQYLRSLPEGSQSFAGLKEYQLWGSTLAFARLEYRYKHKKDIFAHLIYNWLITAKMNESGTDQAENLGGAGVGITLLSPLGPLEFIWSWGPKSIYSENGFQNLYHFSAGYRF